MELVLVLLGGFLGTLDAFSAELKHITFQQRTAISECRGMKVSVSPADSTSVIECWNTQTYYNLPSHQFISLAPNRGNSSPKPLSLGANFSFSGEGDSLLSIERYTIEPGDLLSTLLRDDLSTKSYGGGNVMGIISLPVNSLVLYDQTAWAGKKNLKLKDLSTGEDLKSVVVEPELDLKKDISVSDDLKYMVIKETVKVPTLSGVDSYKRLKVLDLKSFEEKATYSSSYRLLNDAFPAFSAQGQYFIEAFRSDYIRVIDLHGSPRCKLSSEHGFQLLNTLHETSQKFFKAQPHELQTFVSARDDQPKEKTNFVIWSTDTCKIIHNVEVELPTVISADMWFSSVNGLWMVHGGSNAPSLRYTSWDRKATDYLLPSNGRGAFSENTNEFVWANMGTDGVLKITRYDLSSHLVNQLAN